MRGERLREMRVQRGFTQEELAQRIGIGNRQIWRYENEETEPDGKVIARIARELHCTADYLLGLSDIPTVELATSSLTPREQRIITALRGGLELEAIRIIVND